MACHVHSKQSPDEQDDGALCQGQRDDEQNLANEDGLSCSVNTSSPRSKEKGGERSGEFKTDMSNGLQLGGVE
jgi:hypothetical protein